MRTQKWGSLMNTLKHLENASLEANDLATSLTDAFESWKLLRATVKSSSSFRTATHSQQCYGPYSTSHK